VLATQRLPDLLKPRRKQSPREVYGSRVVIDGKRIPSGRCSVSAPSAMY
jgi:hypothetical protein